MFKRNKKPETKMFTLRLTSEEMSVIKKLQKSFKTKTLSETVRECIGIALRVDQE